MCNIGNVYSPKQVVGFEIKSQPGKRESALKPADSQVHSQINALKEEVNSQQGDANIISSLINEKDWASLGTFLDEKVQQGQDLMPKLDSLVSNVYANHNEITDANTLLTEVSSLRNELEEQNSKFDQLKSEISEAHTAILKGSKGSLAASNPAAADGVTKLQTLMQSSILNNQLTVPVGSYSILGTVSQAYETNFFAQALQVSVLMLQLSQAVFSDLQNQQLAGLSAASDCSDMQAFLDKLANSNFPGESPADMIKKAATDPTSDEAKAFGPYLGKLEQAMGVTQIDANTSQGQIESGVNTMINNINSESQQAGSTSAPLPNVPVNSFGVMTTLQDYVKTNDDVFKNFATNAGTLNQTIAAYVANYQKTVDANGDFIKSINTSYSNALSRMNN